MLHSYTLPRIYLGTYTYQGKVIDSTFAIRLHLQNIISGDMMYIL